jgi:hypothetical protein
MTTSSDNKAGTRQVCFRISDSKHEEFIDLLGDVPGAEAGNMFREIFARGLKSLQDFYTQQGIVKQDGSETEEGA